MNILNKEIIYETNFVILFFIFFNFSSLATMDFSFQNCKKRKKYHKQALENNTTNEIENFQRDLEFSRRDFFFF